MNEKIDDAYLLISDSSVPTLSRLIDTVEKYPNDFRSIDVSVLVEYDSSSKLSYHFGKYYLYGQLLVETNSPLTKSLMKKAVAVHCKKLEDCPPAHQMDFFSIEREMVYFKNFIAILKKYGELSVPIGNDNLTEHEIIEDRPILNTKRSDQCTIA